MFLLETVPQYQKGLLKFRIKYGFFDSTISWLLILFLVGTLNNSTTALPFTCYKIYGIAGPVKENIIHYNGETVFNQKTATASFAFASPVPLRTQFQRFQFCSPTPALSGRSPTAQTSMASRVKSSFADSWGLL